MSVLVDIFRDYFDTTVQTSDACWVRRHWVIHSVKKMLKCRTLWLGVRSFHCENEKCDHVIFVPNTCKTKCCPSCGFKASLNWQGAFLHRAIPADYQHIVVALPSRLRDIALTNRRIICNLMFRSINKTIQEFCQEKEGYLPGIVAVYQNFNKVLGHHPHFHIIKTAGGIALKGKKRWINSAYISHTFLRERWKAKMVAGLRGLHRQGKLRGQYAYMDKLAFNQLVAAAYQQDWFVWIGQPEESDNFIPYFYITRYLSRLPISSRRIVAYSKSANLVRWLPQSKHALSKTSAFVSTAVEFIEKLTLHFPDKNDRHIFYAGLYAPTHRQTYYKAAMRYFTKKRKKEGYLDRLKKFVPTLWAKLREITSGFNPLQCPKCGSKMKMGRFHTFTKEDIEVVILSHYQIVPRDKLQSTYIQALPVIEKYYNTS